MTKAPNAPQNTALDALVERARVVRPPTQAELDTGLDVVRERMERRRLRQRLFTQLALVAALALVPIALLVGSRVLSPTLPPLTYEVQGGRVLEGGYLREAGHTGVDVAFSEGSRFLLLPGSRGRLRMVSAERARVGIEHGSALVEVTPDTGRLWEVEAGPFVVTVTGTAFTLDWNPADEVLELRLRHGQVVVNGPILGGKLTLQSGQRLTVNLSKATTLITEEHALDEARGVASLGSVAPPTGSVPLPSTSSPSIGEHNAPQASGSTAVSAAAPSTDVVSTPNVGTTEPDRSGPKRRWSDELAHGRWDAILADAESAGLAATLDGASSEDLLALANAARYRHRLTLAHDALQSLRRRFAQSPRALDAVFLLGRVHEAQAQGSRQAITWYDEYLARAPNGSYAAEALGRKLTIVNKTSGPTPARPIARDYLRRFPEGSYARLAQALLDER